MEIEFGGLHIISERSSFFWLVVVLRDEHKSAGSMTDGPATSIMQRSKVLIFRAKKY